jgi:RNA polymerase subunit RPABC4/transcription elongation factor Spt4
MNWRGLLIIIAASGSPLRKEAMIKITLKALNLGFLH